MKFSIKYFFRKCDQIRRKKRISSHLLKKSLVTHLISCVMFPEKVIDIFFAILKTAFQFKFCWSFRKYILFILLRFLWYITVLVTFWNFLLGKNRNRAWWSEMLIIILPAIRSSGKSAEKMLSISVLELVLTLVREVI